VPTYGSKSTHRPDAARKLASVIQSSRTGTKAPLTGLRAGRIDRTRVARLGMRDLRVFHAPHTPAPQRIRVGILLDASGSMVGHEANITLQLARDLAEATLLVPAIPVGGAEIWAHSTGRDYVTRETQITMYPLWKKGIPTERVDRYLQANFSGNEDGWALASLGDRLLEQIRPGETGIIFVISDGAPAYSVGGELGGKYVNALSHVSAVAEGYRKRGIAVVSVSVSRSLNVATQVGMYGRDNVVAYDSNMTVTASRIAKAIGAQLNPS
jgi:hypothetical protein